MGRVGDGERVAVLMSATHRRDADLPVDRPPGRSRRKARLAALTGVAALTGTLAFTVAPAVNASPGTIAQAACGSAYTTTWVNRPFSGGTLIVLGSGSGALCAVTVKTRYVGSATDVGVSLGPRTDDGNYRSYAGPVYYDACAWADGWTVDGSSGSVWVCA